MSNAALGRTSPVRTLRRPTAARRRLAATVVVAAALAAVGSAPAPAAAADATALTWAPPELTNPVEVRVTATNHRLRLQAGRDYVVRMPAEPLEVLGGLTISGGDDVVLVGGEIRVPDGATSTDARGLYLKDQTGTVHVEGLRIAGRDLAEGINLDQRLGAVVQLQNVRVETVHGTRAGHHADVLQTWAGPRVLRVDGLTGSTTYQGLFLLPLQMGTQPAPDVVDLRRVDLEGTPESGYLLWRDTLGWPLRLQDVWVSPRDPASRDSFLWPKGSGAGTEVWPEVLVGSPPDGDFVPLGSAGVGYVSPGYAAAEPAPEPTAPEPTAPDVEPEPGTGQDPGPTTAPLPGPSPAPDPDPSPAPEPEPADAGTALCLSARLCVTTQHLELGGRPEAAEPVARLWTALTPAAAPAPGPTGRTGADVVAAVRRVLLATTPWAPRAALPSHLAATARAGDVPQR